MKKTNYIALILIVCFAFCFALTACGKKPSGGDTKTLESFVSKNSSMMKEFEKIMEANEGLTIEFKGNDIIYTYDMTVLGSDTETLKSDIMKESLGKALDEQKATFGDIYKTVEEETGIQGIQTIVNYTAGEELLISKTFTSADAE